MNVFAYVASRHNPVSNTERLLTLLLAKLKLQLSEKIEVIHFNPMTLQQENCLGCESCFNSGYCTLDRTDSFDKIKRMMMSSDLLIFGTPVYGATVSGDMKTFIDRLSYWCHLMPLAGRYGVPIVTASTNNAIETAIYLRNVMEFLGLCVPCTIPCTVDAPAMLDDSHFTEQTLVEYSRKITSYYLNSTLTTSSTQERYFQGLKRMYGDITQKYSAEASYWKEHGYLNYNNFSDLINVNNRNSESETQEFADLRDHYKPYPVNLNC
jgi:multimeric flavodoxin WrbA